MEKSPADVVIVPGAWPTQGVDVNENSERRTKAEDILFVLNELEPVALDEIKFSVITDASSLRAGMGPAAGRVVDMGEPSFSPFEKGEIIINYGDGSREIFGEGRKSAKWDVHEESFDTLAEAQECRRKVLAGDWPRVYGEAPRG